MEPREGGGIQRELQTIDSTVVKVCKAGPTRDKSSIINEKGLITTVSQVNIHGWFEFWCCRHRERAENHP